MRDLLNKTSGTAIAIAAVALLSAGSASAQAVVINPDFACFVMDANGAIQTMDPPALGGDARFQAVVTPSGNTKVTCNGTLTTGALPANRAVIFNGPEDGQCGTPIGATDDWHQVVTKKGRVALTCHINGQ